MDNSKVPALIFHFQFLAFEKSKKLMDITLISEYKKVIRMIKSCHTSKISMHVFLFLFYDINVIWCGMQQSASFSKDQSFQERLKYFRV